MLVPSSSFHAPRGPPCIWRVYEQYRGAVHVSGDPGRNARLGQSFLVDNRRLATFEDPDGNFFQIASPMPAQ
jgi:hypothetical protein